MDVRDVEAVAEVADVIQIGARNMQNYTLLTRGRPVRRARCCSSAGLSATLEELLMAAEYILKEGNDQVILCERGIRTFETAYRFTLDLTAVPVLKELTPPPGDRRPVHAAGRRDWSSRCRSRPPRPARTASSSRSTPTPTHAICDGPQQLPRSDFAAFAQRVEDAAALAGKALSGVVAA